MRNACRPSSLGLTRGLDATRQGLTRPWESTLQGWKRVIEEGDDCMQTFAFRDRADAGSRSILTPPHRALGALINAVTLLTLLAVSVCPSHATEAAVTRKALLSRDPSTARPLIIPVGHHGAHVVVGPSQPAPRVGPSYLHPDPTQTPGAVNPNITPANIHATICNSQWSTKSIRPPVSYTNDLKKKQRPDPPYQDKTPGHYEEDNLISLDWAARYTCHPIRVPPCCSSTASGSLTRLQYRRVVAGRWPQ